MSPATIRLYGQAVTFFARWLEAQGRESTLEELSRPAVREWLAIDCGVRISEACGLTVPNLDLDQGMALVLGKGSKVRPVYFGARTARSVDRYVQMRRQHRWSHVDALFLT